MTDNTEGKPQVPQGAAPRVSEPSAQSDADQVIRGDRTYDSVSDQAQEFVRREWKVSVAKRLAEMNLEVEFSTAGEAWGAEADAEGRPVIRTPPSPG